MLFCKIKYSARKIHTDTTTAEKKSRSFNEPKNVPRKKNSWSLGGLKKASQYQIINTHPLHPTPLTSTGRYLNDLAQRSILNMHRGLNVIN